MSEQDIRIGKTDQVNIAGRDIVIDKTQRPIVCLSRSEQVINNKHMLVLRNVGGSAAINVSYAFNADGHESITVANLPAIAANDEIALTRPFIPDDKQITDLSANYTLAVSYSDAEGRKYSYTYPDGNEQCTDISTGIGVVLTYESTQAKDFTITAISDALWKAAVYWEDTKAVSIYPPGVPRGTDRRTDTGVEVNFNVDSMNLRGRFIITRNGNVVLSYDKSEITHNNYILVPKLISELLEFLIFISRLHRHLCNELHGKVTLRLSNIQGSILNDAGIAIEGLPITYESSEDSSEGTAEIQQPSNSDLVVVSEQILQECLFAYRGKNALNPMLPQPDIRSHRWQPTQGYVGKVLNEIYETVCTYDRTTRNYPH